MLQKRIDQYFKSTISKRRSNVMTNVKKSSGLKNIPYSRIRKKKKNEEQNTSLSQRSVQSDSMSNCTIRHEKVNEIEDIDTDAIELLFQSCGTIERNDSSLCRNNDIEESSKNVVGIKHVQSSLTDTSDIIKKKIVNDNEICLRTPNKDNNIHLKRTPNKRLRTPDSNNSPTANCHGSISPSKRSKYSPKVSITKNITPKKLFGHTTDSDIVIKAIEYMNLAKEGAIPKNNFDLEEIYSSGTFDYQYGSVNTKTSMKYELNEVIFCNDLKSKILYTTIFTVLSNPINCGYFDEKELDFIYSIVTLPKEAQMLLACMIKRKRTWYRKSNIKYPEIASDLHNVFKLLASQSVCTFEIKTENISTLLDLLQVDEIRQLCKNMKIDTKGKKEIMIGKLLKLSKNKSLFPGAKKPNNILYTYILDILEYCIRITDRTWNLIDKIITLLIPNQVPKMSIADTFFKLYDNYTEKVKFPNVPATQFPIFSCELHLVSYIQAKSVLFSTLQSIEKKDWKNVQYYGNSAMEILPNILKVESLRLQNSTLPMHVRRFMPGYVWLKILSKCIDAFKKDKDKKRVIEILNFLIEQNCHMSRSKGRWYNELALIKMVHYKDVEASASIIIQALGTQNLSRVDKVELLERANKIYKRKTGVKSLTKFNINEVLNDHNDQMPKYKTPSNTINASMMPKSAAGSKSVWCIESNSESQMYGSVEMLASYHYCEQGFSNALHCEGELPILLFVTLFWEELYDIHIPGAFVTPYQHAPDDLFTEHFYENRKEKLDMKLQIINDFDPESLSMYMETRFKTFSQYQSIMNSSLLKSSSQLKEIVCCIGVHGIIGICKRLIENFKLWKAGFPDLIVWNYNTKQHKIVEVKGPRDVLSTKQQLWLEYLNQLGLSTELCLVRDKFSAKNSMEDLDDHE
ncbi:fanconi-associated nuclease 1-like [Hylaeus anthracinus]|uniref:fanconi-associated nuclease 1-like n=1 Tax=Hylaeus anthracinus TaxID=313031 RepID=UPI0023BA1D53|nr:fanconi-associated nuclease 1-like [Hylaeus anthracinus]